MPHESANPETTFGYLSMLEIAEHGYFGGYLIVSLLGRPMEFHCTAPVRPSRAQRILYGPTLEPYLLGEQIAGALLEVASLTPSLILANNEATIPARSRAGVPIVLLSENADRSSDAFTQTSDPAGLSGASIAFRGRVGHSAASHGSFAVGSCDFRLPLGYESEQDAVTQLLNELARQVDLAEPFDRIEEAIREAQRLGGRGAEANDQAA